jgi:hypothetical protein
LGITRIFDLWWFASIFVQYADADEIDRVELSGVDTEANIFGATSPMGLIRHVEAQHGDISPGGMHALALSIVQPLTFGGRPIKRVLITAEKQRRIWDPATHFYAYEEMHPSKMQKGIAIVTTFRVDLSRTGTLTLVILPDPEDATGRKARVAGQFEFASPLSLA